MIFEDEGVLVNGEQAATRACLQREIERNMEIEFENNELSESINVVSRESDRRITRKVNRVPTRVRAAAL